MDAVEFLKERRRMCNAQDACKTCPIDVECRDLFVNNKCCPDIVEKMVSTVEQWAKEHPIKTRQSEFLKMFPNATLYDGVVGVDPCDVDETFECKYCGDCSSKCRHDYWLQEVE